MQVYGLMMVRNEEDILSTNIWYHLALGIDHFLVVDNGSEDATPEVLDRLARGGRLAWTRDSGPYRQSEITTALAHEAFLRGADWVVPIDADEFWFAPSNDFRAVLERSSAGALRAEVVNYIQRRDQIEATPEALLQMTRRAPQCVGPLARVAELVNAGKFGFVEMVYAPKWISRASLSLEIGVGNHGVCGTVGPLEATDRVLCLHAPLRSRSVFDAQVGHGVRAAEVGNTKTWHWQRWVSLAANGELDREWAANSYDGDVLDVYGEVHPLVADFRLHDALLPFIGACVPNAVAQLPPDQPLIVNGCFGKCSAPFVEPLLERMRTTEGWFTPAEARLLIFAAALGLAGPSARAIVEIGSYCGRSTIVLGSTVKAICSAARVFAIDPHGGELAAGEGPGRPTLERFRANIRDAGLDAFVETVIRRSFEVEWYRPIGLLLIDGLHDYENVSWDFNHFQSWVVPGGFIAFHDYGDTYPGVRTFVEQVLANGGYSIFHCTDTLMILERDGKATDQDAEPAAARIKRQQEGIALLRDVLRNTIASQQTDLSARDGRFVALQEELFAKVSERDRTIRGLQEELQSKVAECNRVIRELQAELHQKVSDRDRTIVALQSEFFAKIEERDRMICELQAKLAETAEIPSSK